MKNKLMLYFCKEHFFASVQLFYIILQKKCKNLQIYKFFSITLP